MNLVRYLAFGVAAVGSGWALSVAAEGLGAKTGQIRIEVGLETQRKAALMRRSHGLEDVRRIAFLGDSTTISFADGLTIPHYLHEYIDARSRMSRRVRVVSMASSALGAPSYYFLADAIASGRPDVVVWEVSLAHFTDRWVEKATPELAGWMSLERVAEALFLPVQTTGLTFDALLFHKTLVRFHAAEHWLAAREELSRVDKLRGLLEQRLAGSSRSPEQRFRGGSIAAKAPVTREDRPDRFNLAGEREHLGTTLEGHIPPDNPTLVFLRATLRRFRELGIPVQVYLNPINVDNVEAVGALDRDALARSIREVDDAVTGEGARFLDLHDLLPDESFDDPWGHFVQDDAAGAAKRVGDAIGAALLDGVAREMWRR